MNTEKQAHHKLVKKFNCIRLYSILQTIKNYLSNVRNLLQNH